MELSPHHLKKKKKSFEDEFSCKIKLSNFHSRRQKQGTVDPSHPGAEHSFRHCQGPAPWTLIAPLTISGEDARVHLSCGQAVALGSLVKALRGIGQLNSLG